MTHEFCTPCSLCQQDPRFNKEVDRQTGYHTKSLLCKPVKNNEGEVSLIKTLEML